MTNSDHSTAFGAPGIEPRWTSSAKEGVGTSYHTSCRLWFTLSHGIVNEIYYPHVDQPNTRDFQFLITDGEAFCHEEKRDLTHTIEYSERDSLFYRLTNSDPGGRYRIVKHVLTDPHRSVLLVQTKLEVRDESLGGKLMHAQRGNTHLIMACGSGFTRSSVGYVGYSDGWQDLMNGFKMDWEFRKAENGNIALTGEINLPENGEFMIAIAFGRSYQTTAIKLFQSLAEPFAMHMQRYVSQWQRSVVDPKFDFSKDTSDGGGMYRLSRCVLLAHEDKVFQGALVASMSMPWGETKGDQDLGGYHLVWTRDLVHSAAQVALQQGKHVGAVIAARLAGKPAPGPFRYFDKGNLAVVGRNFAIMGVGRFHLAGFFAWLIWGAVHLLFLAAPGNRIRVVPQWIWSYFTRQRGSRLILGSGGAVPLLDE